MKQIMELAQELEYDNSKNAKTKPKLVQEFMSCQGHDEYVEVVKQSNPDIDPEVDKLLPDELKEKVQSFRIAIYNCKKPKSEEQLKVEVSKWRPTPEGTVD